MDFTSLARILIVLATNFNPFAPLLEMFFTTSPGWTTQNAAVLLA
ncbi:hypothetical protein [Thermogemmatispora tikiterensis]|nr:hypothetical protein [Thermogemmatispora tikiterensis]